ncbi:DNA/RNA helicase, superfamily I [Frankia casuarinae]|uniref:DNA 3'-5' helicase n=1 Tax=Frankia casuarinae (strain DSM 45818 / CECT 9043 / HFP020203 / CcI3) TaxID=106370 RepID=Q2J6E3_FRACC|nr:MULTISPECIES: ATP-dependent DNA helicase [Frankia]ABD13149.1 UvrD/REP helicase [Frankia casuarinae]ETA01280.1 DNA/RNA helicase, superfamily I [Frankia sp. CcI6]EYT90340.1 DNA/RNA helicase, superfamily I [Frankia casuarinae]KDA42025.1 DNA/RNA helicase, superfamily I [Frankia sp. BMG5.23]KFB06309.1 DNA/RNA helicase, superfamily I [Frankia sp. Allo2]
MNPRVEQPGAGVHVTIPRQPFLPGFDGDVDGDPAGGVAGPRLDPDDLRDLLEVPYTDEQIAAATAPLEPGVIIAGAGSGKTSVMAARVVWLVATGQVRPDQVLGLTFTTKAAAELSGRVRLALRKASAGAGPGGPAADGEVDGEPTVATYHAFAGRLVVDNALRLGLEPDLQLISGAARYQLAARVARSHGGKVEALTRSLGALVGELVALDAEMSEHLVDPADLVAFDGALLAEIDAALRRAEQRRGTRGVRRELRRCAAAARGRRELAALVAEYRAARRERDVLDFGDQVTCAARLAETMPEVGRAERARAAVVLLDEYQDTSVAQRRMLTGLFGGGHPVTAVGDPCQAIYGWRGASVANLDHFPTHFPGADGTPAAVYELSVNQRSGGRLLRLANTVAAQLRARHRVVELRPRPDVADQGEAVVALHVSWADEVAWIAGQLRRVVDAGTAPGDIAVLVRARGDIPALFTAMQAAGLPVEVVGLTGLLIVPEVAEIVAMLEVLDSPTANAALVRLLTGPRVRLGPRDLAALGRHAREAARVPDPVGDPDLPGRSDPLAEAVADVDPADVVALSDVLDDPGPQMSAPGRARVRRLAAEIAALRGHVGEGLLDLLHRVVATIGLDVELTATEVAVRARRQENVAAFLDVAAGFTDPDGTNSLPAFLGFLRAAREHERGLDVAGPSGADAIALMTMHRSKGLEWEVVAVPNLTSKVFPDLTVRDQWTTSPGVLPIPLRGDADDLPAFTVCAEKAALDAFRADARQYAEREERRLAYVAVTRAKSLLFASGHWWGPTQKTPRGASVFLDELAEHARTGGGLVDVWAPEPAERTNPALATPERFAWPIPYEPEPYARRLAAAEGVMARLAALSVPGASAEPAGEPFVDGPAGMTAAERVLLAELDREARLLLAEERAARLARTDVALPASLTASQIVRLRADPEAFARELVRPLPRRPVAAARRGTRFHAWVEEIFDYRALIDTEDLPGAADAELTDDDLRSLQQAFLRTAYGARRPFAIEAPFELRLAGRIVRGRIDAVYDLGGGRWEVVDWKTGRSDADDLQLGIYRLAWARLRGVDPSAVDAAFLYVRTGAVVRPPTLSEEELADLLASPSTGPAAGQARGSARSTDSAR